MIQKIKSFQLKYFVYFFIIIAGFTMLSNFISYYSLPQVNVSSSQSGALSLTFHEEATVKVDGVQKNYAEFSGTIKKVWVNDGDEIDIDAPLYQYEVKNIEKEKKALEGQITDLEYDQKITALRMNNTSSDDRSKVDKAYKKYMDNQSLYQSGVLSKADLDSSYDNYQTELKALETSKDNQIISYLEQQKSYESNRRTLEEKRNTLEALETIIKKDGMVYSKIKGVVKERHLLAGQKASKDTLILSIETQDSDRIVEITIPKNKGKYYKNGDELQVESATSDAELKGLIQSIKTSPDNKKQVTMKIKIVSETPIKSGTQLSIKGFKSSKRYPVIIPKTALVTENNKSFVWLVETEQRGFGQQTILKKSIVVKGDSDDNTVVIKTGLEPTDQIVVRVTNEKTLQNGSRVMVNTDN